jgi:hypothetical protein
VFLTPVSDVSVVPGWIVHVVVLDAPDSGAAVRLGEAGRGLGVVDELVGQLWQSKWSTSGGQQMVVSEW